MKVGYPTLIRHAQGFIISIWVPDLDWDLLEDNEDNQISLNELGTSDFTEWLQHKLSKKITAQDPEEFTLPKKLKEHKFNREKNSLSHLENPEFWIKVYVEIPSNNEKKEGKGPAECCLPVFGVGNSVLANISYGITGILSVLLTSSAKSAMGLLGIFGVVMSVLTSLMIYYFSNARHSLGLLGKKIDQFKKRTPNREHTSTQKALTCRGSTSTIISAIGPTILVISSSVIAGVIKYQSTMTLGEKALNLTDSDSAERELLNFAAIVLAIIAIINNASFDGGYGLDLYNATKKKIAGCFTPHSQPNSPQLSIQNREPLELTTLTVPHKEQSSASRQFLTPEKEGSASRRLLNS